MRSVHFNKTEAASCGICVFSVRDSDGDNSRTTEMKKMEKVDLLHCYLVSVTQGQQLQSSIASKV